MDELLFFAFITAAFMILPTICGILAGLFRPAKKIGLILGCLFCLLPWILFAYVESQTVEHTLEEFSIELLFFVLMFIAGCNALFFSYRLKKNLSKYLSGLILTFFFAFGILNLVEYVLDQSEKQESCVFEPSERPVTTDSNEQR